MCAKRITPDICDGKLVYDSGIDIFCLRKNNTLDFITLRCFRRCRYRDLHNVVVML